jgi:hypothetical protein
MKSPEERARIARENGAKSKGPVTPEGKEKSSRNALKDGTHAEKLALFLPPHGACLCNEDRKVFYKLMDEHLAAYRPQNEAAARIIREIAIARWEIGRFHILVSSHWNLAIIENAKKPCTLAPEFAEVQAMVRASEDLYTGKGILTRLNREIDRLEARILRLQRQFKNTPAEKTQPVENTQPEAPKEPETTENEPAIHVTENTPAVIAAYKMMFPGRKIVVLPPDDVANGIEPEDDLPVAPRKAA